MATAGDVKERSIPTDHILRPNVLKAELQRLLREAEDFERKASGLRAEAAQRLADHLMDYMLKGSALKKRAKELKQREDHITEGETLKRKVTELSKERDQAALKWERITSLMKELEGPPQKKPRQK